MEENRLVRTSVSRGAGFTGGRRRDHAVTHLEDVAVDDELRGLVVGLLGGGPRRSYAKDPLDLVFEALFTGLLVHGPSC